jgi:deferrochelatase/peroxidase EfeB
VSGKCDDLIRLLCVWILAEAAMTAGQPVLPDIVPGPGDSGEAMGLPTARLMVTFGFGGGLSCGTAAAGTGRPARL